METLSNVKIESILSLSGNNKCFECESPEVDWVSFPAAIFICLNCGRRHKEFKFKPILKSLSVSEFTQHEIKKMNLGGNARYHALLDEYKISMKEPNIEYKYQTMISKYYFKLLETQVNKIENNIGADDEYNKILGERPTYDIGRQFSEGFITKEGDEIEEVKESNEIKGNNDNKDSSLGSWLGYFGDKINSATEYLGINNAIHNVSNKINNSIENFSLKDTIDKAVDYSKTAGEYVLDTAKKIAENQIYYNAKEKFGPLTDKAIKMVKDVTSNNNNNP
jgi:hypothetical protein